MLPCVQSLMVKFFSIVYFAVVNSMFTKHRIRVAIPFYADMGAIVTQHLNHILSVLAFLKSLILYSPSQISNNYRISIVVDKMVSCFMDA
jgi:hypothetical protein